MRFGDQYALLDWRVRSASGKIDVEFTLAKLKPDETPWAYFLQIVTPDGKLLTNVNTYPAHGVLSTSYLPQGTVLHESYELPVTAPVPPDSRLLLGLWAPLATGQRLPAFDAAGQPLPRLRVRQAVAVSLNRVASSLIVTEWSAFRRQELLRLFSQQRHC